MDISQIITPYDAIKLDDKQQYQFYFELLQCALKGVADNSNRLQSKELNLQEIAFIQIALKRLLYTVNALELRYLHIEDQTMEIDVTESGYPNASALRFLANEISFLEKEGYKDMEGVEGVVKDMVDTLMVQKKRISKDDVAKAAFALFHNNIDKNKLHHDFVFGGVRKSESEGAKYVSYWINYDKLYNRPFVSIMYFNLTEKKNGFPTYDEELMVKAIQETQPTSTLQSVIYDIDKRLEDIEPVSYKRIDLGPISSVFARDERKLTEGLRLGIVNKHLPADSFAVELIVEKISSIGSVETGGRFSFISKKNIQNWGEKEEYHYLMAPHNVIQHLYTETNDLIKSLALPPIDVPAKEHKLNEL